VVLTNDLAAAAWGELVCGAAKGARDTFTVFVGTGVGSAVIAHGVLVRGATGVAGEFGHLKVADENGRACGCGQRGCLEAYAGGGNLAAWMREVGLPGQPTDLEAQAERGVPEAKRLYDFAVGQLALSVANQVTFLNPAVVVLGGGVLSPCPGMFRRISEAVAQRSSVAAARAVKVVKAALGDDAGLVGAALLAASGRAQDGV
jgi:glucokinase